MGWGEQQSLDARIGALRSQLDLAERKRDAATARADAWRAVHEAHLASYSAAESDDDDVLDAAIKALADAIDRAEALEP